MPVQIRIWTGTKEEAKKVIEDLESGNDIKVGSPLIQVANYPEYRVIVWVDGKEKTANYYCGDGEISGQPVSLRFTILNLLSSSMRLLTNVN